MMSDNPTPNDIDLETFLKAAGQTFTEAQRALLPGLDIPVNMMLSNADLELKVAVSTDAKGNMAIRPISSADMSSGAIDPGMVSTIRVSFVSSIGEMETKPPQSVGDANGGSSVPTLLGRTLDEAAALLKSSGWQFEMHAAGSEEIAAAGKGTRGQVLRQQPAAGKSADKAGTTVHIWANLGSLPVQEIDGVGSKMGDSLSRIGVTTVGELSLAAADEIASALRISETRARRFVDMAGLMSRLAVLGFKDEVVELLVNGANIRSMEQLAEADAAELYNSCNAAISEGKLRVPQAFNFTGEEVEGWIKAAKNFVGGNV